MKDDVRKHEPRTLLEAQNMCRALMVRQLELELQNDRLWEVNQQLEGEIRKRTVMLANTVGRLQEEIDDRHDAERELSKGNARLAAVSCQMRALAGELTMAEHRERKRLAALLHDHLQPLLASAKLRAACLAGQNEEQIVESVVQLVALLNDSLSISRSLVAELCPPLVHGGDFQTTMAWLARWMQETHGMRVELVMEPQSLSMAGDVQILIFESVRELLFNAAKHAETACVRVSLNQVDELSFRIVVSDEGSGFDPAGLLIREAGGGAYGLISIRERMSLIGGSLQIESELGKGSRFTLVIPMGRECVSTNFTGTGFLCPQACRAQEH